jgi:hypothetical protein
MATLHEQVLSELKVITEKMRSKEPEYDVLRGQLSTLKLAGDTFSVGLAYSALMYGRALENIEKRKFEIMMKGKTDGNRND